MKRSEFDELCCYLFGERWQAPLARALGVSGRTARRWASGLPVPAGVIDKLLDMAAKKSQDGERWRR